VIEEVGKGAKSFLKLNFDFPSFQEHFPKQWLKDITPAELLKAGFQKVDPITYKKTFSGVIELEIRISRKRGKSYTWIFKEENFNVMLTELKEIKTFLDKKAEEIYMRVRAPKSVKKRLYGGHGLYTQTHLKDIARITNTVYGMKKKFFGKYKDFLSVNEHIWLKRQFLEKVFSSLTPVRPHATCISILIS